MSYSLWFSYLVGVSKRTQSRGTLLLTWPKFELNFLFLFFSSTCVAPSPGSDTLFKCVLSNLSSRSTGLLCMCGLRANLTFFLHPFFSLLFHHRFFFSSFFRNNSHNCCCCVVKKKKVGLRQIHLCKRVAPLNHQRCKLSSPLSSSSLRWVGRDVIFVKRARPHLSFKNTRPHHSPHGCYLPRP